VWAIGTINFHSQSTRVDVSGDASRLDLFSTPITAASPLDRQGSSRSSSSAIACARMFHAHALTQKRPNRTYLNRTICIQPGVLMGCKHRSSSQYSSQCVFAVARCVIVVLIGIVLSGCAGYQNWQAMRAEKMAQGERLQHIIHSYRVCLHAIDTHPTLPEMCNLDHHRSTVRKRALDDCPAASTIAATITLNDRSLAALSEKHFGGNCAVADAR
jgi:hypothetical protein